MTVATIGAARITRIEETYGFFFEARKFFAEWRDETVAEHLPWMVPDHFDPERMPSACESLVRVWPTEVA